MSLLRTAVRTPLRSFSTPTTTTSRTFTSTPRPSLAKMQIIGRLAAEPELTNTSTGLELVRYTVATNYGPRDDQRTSWFRLTSFEQPGPRRDYLLNLQKGSLLHVDADARMEQYEDAEGKKRTSLSLIHRNIEVLSRPRNIQEAEEGAVAAEASG